MRYTTIFSAVLHLKSFKQDGEKKEATINHRFQQNNKL